jgi:glycosyltransferase involved in cell wall biosynthesis
MSDRLHVCFVTLSFGENSAGGVMHHMVELARALEPEGVSVTVLCPSYGEPWEYIHDGIIDVIAIREARIDWALAPSMLGFGRRVGPALLDLHRRRPLDVIHLHDRPPYLGATSASERLGPPVIYTAHSCFGARSERGRLLPLTLERLMEREIARAGTPIIAVSRWIADGMVKLGADPRRLRVIPNGVDSGVFPYRGGDGRQPDEILFVGRLDYEKGVDVLLRAMARLGSEPAVCLRIVGEGEQAGRLRELMRDLGLGGRVEFCGRLYGADLVAAYHRAAVCVLPSRAEPFGLVMLEAMACGTPFIGSAAGGIAEVVRSEQTGLLVPPGDPDALAAAIARLLGDRQLARRLAEQARCMVEREYPWREIAARTRGVYDELRGGRRPEQKQPAGGPGR